MNAQNERSIWVVSSEPASSEIGADRSSMASLSFRERVPVDELRALVKEFSHDLGEIFDELAQFKQSFQVDSVEINAVMAADGKLGILGSSVGMKAEGGIKFVLKRSTQGQGE